MFGAILQSIGRTRQILYGSLGILAIKAVLNVILYKAVGPTGPIFGSLLLGTLATAYFLKFISRELGTTPTRVWPWKYHFRAIVAGVVAGAAAFPVNFIPKEALSSAIALVSHWAAGKASIIAALQVVAGGAIFVPVYVLLLHSLKVLKEKDWQLLKDMTYGRFIRE